MPTGNTEADLLKLCSFINGQTYLRDISIEALRAARSREELGITSLEVILLVSNYMQSAGLAESCFKPEWVMALDDLPGIIRVFKEIDGAAQT
jgi:hypothetical protein